MTGRPILTAEEMRTAEAAVIAAGSSVGALMERAGEAVAETAWRMGGGSPVLILCGPGNNGGDGYVAARLLAARGVAVRVARSAPPRGEAATAAARAWSGPVGPVAAAGRAPMVVDALFGTGLGGGLEPALADTLERLVTEARVSLAVDLPSGVASDDGRLLSPVPEFDATLALGALKPGHRLQPAAAKCGRIVVADLGITASSQLHEIARPHLSAPGPSDHKYSRGMVAVVAGAMPGAAALSAQAALRSGAGYVLLAGDEDRTGWPHAIVRRRGKPAELLGDQRIGAIVVGPGLGPGQTARDALRAALGADRPLVIDADALSLLAEGALFRLRRAGPAVLTPHEGEFARLFGEEQGSKVERVRGAAARAGAVVLLKGADSVVAAPDGRAAIAPPAPGWLASAGTGDVLAGIVGAMLAKRFAPFDAGCAALWIHGEAARLAGSALIADDIILQLPHAAAACL